MTFYFVELLFDIFSLDRVELRPHVLRIGVAKLLFDLRCCAPHLVFLALRQRVAVFEDVIRLRLRLFGCRLFRTLLLLEPVDKITQIDGFRRLGWPLGRVPQVLLQPSPIGFEIRALG